MKHSIEIGIIGAGWWACQAYLPVLLKDPTIKVSVVHRELGGLNRIGAQFPVEAGYTDVADMLQDRPLDGVIVSSPHQFHAEHALMAIACDLPVLVEKPMAVTAADARAVLEAASTSGVEVMLPYGWNFNPMTELARGLITDGWVGPVRHVSAHMASALKDLFAGQPPARTKQHLFQPTASTWADPNRAGGYGWGQLTHALGVVFHLVDQDPRRVFARVGLSPTGVDYYDAAVVDLDGGGTMTLSGSATVPASRSFQLDIRIFGDDGMLLFDIERARVEAVRHDGSSHVAELGPDAGRYETDTALARFVALCRGKRIDNPASARVGLRATQLIEAMHSSVRSGQMADVA